MTELAPASVITHRAFLRWLPRFSANFSVDYAAVDPQTKAPTGDALKMTTLYERLRRLGWSAGMFETRAGEFLDTHRWPNWTIADFFGEGAQPVGLHPHSWYLERINEVKANAEAIACYLDDQGRKGWGWIHELDGRLERAPQERGWRVESLPEPEEPAPDVREQLELTKITLERDDLASQVTRLSAQVSELTAERDDARATRDLHADTIVAYERLVTDLLDGTLTVDGLRAEMATPDPPEMTDEEILREAGQPEMFAGGGR